MERRDFLRLGAFAGVVTVPGRLFGIRPARRSVPLPSDPPELIVDELVFYQAQIGNAPSQVPPDAPWGGRGRVMGDRAAWLDVLDRETRFPIRARLARTEYRGEARAVGLAMSSSGLLVEFAGVGPLTRVAL